MNRHKYVAMQEALTRIRQVFNAPDREYPPIVQELFEQIRNVLDQSDMEHSS